MLKIQLISDIHTEMTKDAGKALVESMNSEGIDILILAGDIMPLNIPSKCLNTIKYLIDKGYGKILYVMGNHDLWGSTPDEAHFTARMIEDTYKDKFHYLYTGKVLELEGKRFLGDTMWFPETQFSELLKNIWPDFRLIKARGIPRYNREWFYNKNYEFRKFLDKELKEGDIVITHHLPSYKSIAEFFKNEPTNCYYLSNMENLIEEKKPSVWVHGHTHNFFDYQFHSTRVMCNPQDYPQYAPPPAKNFTFSV